MATLPRGAAEGADSDQLLVEAHGSVRTVILNRPKQLNALSSTMIRGLLRCFTAYEKDDGVRLLIIKGNRKAFCAGGDVAECAAYVQNGEYVALTGARLDGAEMLACGLATHFVQSDMLVLLEESLKMLDTSNSSVVCGIIDQFSQQPPLKDNSSLNRIEIINKCFSKRTVEGIIYALEQEASNLVDQWVAATIKSLKRASPTSLKISLKSIREGRTQTIGECLRREYRMVCHVLRGDFSRDLSEGYRAVLLDKDNNPKWMPARLEQVTDDAVEQYFSRIDDPEWEDLNLPPIHSYRRDIKSKI